MSQVLPHHAQYMLNEGLVASEVVEHFAEHAQWYRIMQIGILLLEPHIVFM